MDFLFRCKKCPKAFSNSVTCRKHICQAPTNQRTDMKSQIGLSISEDAELSIKDNGLMKKEKRVKTENDVTENQEYTSNTEIVQPFGIKKDETIVKGGSPKNIKNKCTEKSDVKEIVDIKELKLQKKSFKCEICAQDLATEKGFAVHMKIHSMEQKVSCLLPDCEKTFNLKRNRSVHMLNAHGYNKDECLNLRVKCPKCYKMFKAGWNFETHINITHSEERKYLCDLCPKRFKFIRNFDEHNNFHKRIFNFHCSECDKRYISKSALHLHTKAIHTDQQPEQRFSCDKCFKSFQQACLLKTHYTLHTGEKKLKCREGCDKRFRIINSRDSHERVHKGVKSFQCNFCTRLFMQDSTLKRHIKTHTGIKNHKCKVCDRGFADSRGARNCRHVPI